MVQYADELKARMQHINAVIRDYLPKEEGFQKTLIKAMNYSMEAGGKRLRPMIMECTYQMYGGTASSIAPFMAAIEMIHTSSLVHDDLPALDNDAMRRGKKTTHREFGESMAILAGDALMNYAYETALTAFDGADDPVKVARAMQVLARKTGLHGMLGGQALDVEHDHKPLTEKQVEYINIHKTAALIESCLMVGGILGGAPEEDIEKLESIGRDIGVAFQIRDDVLDLTGNAQQMGKDVGSDMRNAKTTFISLFGVAAGRRTIEKLSERALASFDSLHAENEFLRQLLEELATRNR